jgi:hypothetical protein
VITPAEIKLAEYLARKQAWQIEEALEKEVRR